MIPFEFLIAVGLVCMVIAAFRRNATLTFALAGFVAIVLMTWMITYTDAKHRPIPREPQIARLR